MVEQIPSVEPEYQVLGFVKADGLLDVGVGQRRVCAPEGEAGSDAGANRIRDPAILLIEVISEHAAGLRRPYDGPFTGKRADDVGNS
jgi:hypothetical protein